MRILRDRSATWILRLLGLALLAWASAGAALWAAEVLRQDYLGHGLFRLVFWGGAREYRTLALPFAAAAWLLAVLLALVRALPERRRAVAARAILAFSAAAVLLYLGFRLNRYGFAGFWKTVRNARALPPLGEAAAVLGANLALVLGIAGLAALLDPALRFLADPGDSRRPRLLSRRLALLALLVPLVAIGGSAALRPSAEGRPNVLVIALDTTREDHLTLAGYPRETAPNITRAARGGSVFVETVSQAPWTLSSFASILTGLYPSTHGAYIGTEVRLLGRDHVPFLAKRHATLAERFKDGGYATACEAANTYLRLGLEQGYDHCRVELRPAAAAAGAMLEWLGRNRGKPFFAFLHFNDAHMPNVAPPPFDRIFPTSTGRAHTNEEKWEWKYAGGEELSGTAFEEFREHKVAIYDGTIRFMDAEVGRVLAWLDAEGLAERTIVAIVTDHGEEFWDHAAIQKEKYRDPRGMYGVGHGHTLFDEQLRLLLVLRGPGVPEGRIVPGRVRAIDLGATLLDLAGLPPAAGQEGASLLPFLRGGESADRAAIAEATIYGPDRRAIVQGGYKYIYSPDEPGLLFDIDADPAETRDLLAVEPERAARMRSEIEAWISLHGGKAPSVSGAIDEKTLEELKALGYVR